MPREIKKPTILKDRLKEPPVGKEVCFMQICPKYEREPSPFASLTEDECLNCIYSESVTEEFAPLANKICRYPNFNDHNGDKPMP